MHGKSGNSGKRNSMHERERYRWRCIRSRTGWGILLCFSLLLYFFENNSGTRILLLSFIAVPLLSILSAWYWKDKVRFHLKVPDGLTQGETGSGLIRLERGRMPLFCAAEAELAMRHVFLGEKIDHVCRIREGGGQTFELSSAHCGSLVISLRAAVLSDWFFLSPFEVTCGSDCIVEVKPARLPDTEAEEGESRNSESAEVPEASVTRRNPFEVSEVREYLPGDPVSRIHWKLSAKMQHLMLREGEWLLDQTLLLMLDPERDRYTGASWDQTVSRILSVSHALYAAGMPYGTAVLSADGVPQVVWVDSIDTLKAAESLVLLSAPTGLPAGWTGMLPTGISRVLLFTSGPEPYKMENDMGPEVIPVFSTEVLG